MYFSITNSTSLQGVIFLRATLSCSWVWIVFHPISYIVTMTLSKPNPQRERCDSFLPCLLQQLSQGKTVFHPISHVVTMTLSKPNPQRERCDSYLPCLLQQLSQGKPHRVNQEKKKCVSFLHCCLQTTSSRETTQSKTRKKKVC